MKTNIAYIFLALSSANLCAVTTVNVSNLDEVSTDDRAIVDNSGSVIALSTGSIQVGYFDTFVSLGDFGTANRNELLADFQEFSTTTENFANTFNAPGFFSVQFDETINDLDPIVGKTMHTIVGNGLTLATSTDFVVFRHDGELFAEEVAGVGGNSGLVRPTDGTLMLGAENGDITVLGTLVGSYRMALVPIPEPSSAALLGLGGLALLMRRRRESNL